MSKRFTLAIDTSNDAFQPDAVPELARILRSLADALESRPAIGAVRERVLRFGVRLYGVNGNRVGIARWQEVKDA